MRKAICTLALAALPVGAALGQNAYVLGVSAAMTGPVAGGYAPVVDAMRAYLEHVNGKGGINNHPVRLVVLDDQAQPSRAAANAKQLVNQDEVVMLLNTSLSSTYAPMVAESRRAGVPLYYAGSVCPKDTFPPADPLQFCSTAFGATLDSQAALAFVKERARGPVRIGFGAMAIPVSRAEIDYAEGLSEKLGMTPVDKQITPPPTPDYTPFATRLKAGDPNWVWSWAPWVAQVRMFEALRRLGWEGRYITWAHLNAEQELERIRDGEFYVIGTNAMLEDDLPVHAEMRAVAVRANLAHPVSYLTEGFIAGLVIEQVLKDVSWPPTPAKVQAAMSSLKVDLKGLRGGPLVWTQDNHFRTEQHYRVWRWDPKANRIVRAQDWKTIAVK